MTRFTPHQGQRGRCGVECSRCVYFQNACVGCTPGRTCLIAECIEGRSYTGITYPYPSCDLRSWCPIGRKPRPPPERMLETTTKSMNKIGLPGFIPIIEITDERSWFWKKIELRTVIVNLGQILAGRTLLQEVSRRGLHDYLGFEGRIILSGIMPDEFLDRFDSGDYLRIVRELRPDVATVPDNYTYDDDPLYLSWSQTIRLVNNANAFLRLDIPVLGLCKGVFWNQAYWTIQKQIEMGYRSFVLPARELSREKDDSLRVMLAATVQAFEETKPDAELVIHGRSYRCTSRKELTYSSLSWFLEAKQDGYYKDGSPYDLVDPRVRFESCHCPACNGLRPEDLREAEKRVEILALHNLLEMQKELGAW